LITNIIFFYFLSTYVSTLSQTTTTGQDLGLDPLHHRFGPCNWLYVYYKCWY